MIVKVNGKPHVRDIKIAHLMAYLVATGWEECPEVIIPHEPGPHPFRRGEHGLYFADGYPPHMLANVVNDLALLEKRHPADVLDDIAAQEIGADR